MDQRDAAEGMAEPQNMEQPQNAGARHGGVQDRGAAVAGLAESQNMLHELNQQVQLEKNEVELRHKPMRENLYAARDLFIEGIPSFWHTVLTTRQVTGPLIEPIEGAALRYLRQLLVEVVENGFNIRFIFDENEVFHNQELRKEFRFGNDVTSQSSEIDYKFGIQNLHDVTMESRREAKAADPRTFLHWITDNSDPANDYVAISIVNDIWINPYQTFLAAERKVSEGVGPYEANVNDAADKVQEEAFQDQSAAVGDENLAAYDPEPDIGDPEAAAVAENVIFVEDEGQEGYSGTDSAIHVDGMRQETEYREIDPEAEANEADALKNEEEQEKEEKNTEMLLQIADKEHFEERDVLAAVQDYQNNDTGEISSDENVKFE